MRRFWFSVATLLALATLAPAQVAPPAVAQPSTPVQAAPSTDHQDLVFLGSTRPVLLRVHMLIDGRPYYAPWDDYMKKFFTYFDRNNKGFLSPQDMTRVPNAQFLQNHLRGAIGLGLQGQLARMAEVDTNKDGKVSLDEFKAYYRKAGFSALRFSSSSSSNNANTVTDAMFKHLGAEDGKLTPERVARAETVFQHLDTDEDEMITQAEIAPNLFNRNVAIAPVAFTAARRMAAPEPSGFLQINAGQPIDGILRQVLAHYDKDKNGKLSQPECGLDRGTFDDLDVDHDGQLDSVELKAFFRREPDLEFIVRAGSLVQENKVAQVLKELGSKVTSLPRTEVFNPTKRFMPLAIGVRPVDRDSLQFSLGDSRIELYTNSGTGFNPFQNIRQFYTQQFQSLDTKKKGYLESKEAMANQFLNGIFTLADRDGDGKLYEKELNAYMDMQAQGSGCSAMLQINDMGRSLFDLFDDNKDGRLSIRELRTAWSRLQTVANYSGTVTRADISRRFTIGLGQGQVFRNQQAMAVAAGKPGPLWFRKMDRNNDGDISPREFLGTAEEFRMLDTDGDGLISAEEARQAEARLAKQPEKKP
jgi:Ca2+-binding EF-hand superfamily protein